MNKLMQITHFRKPVDQHVPIIALTAVDDGPNPRIFAAA